MAQQKPRIEKDAVIGIKIPRTLRDKFAEATQMSDMTQAQLLRAWIRNYVSQYEEREKRAA
jgi:metal-responsive CopG/Arc/MetJ family transcriptional regulator